jgi:HAD superfamily hydrolase (TIGR01490 family)
MQAAVFSDVDGTLVAGSVPRMVLEIGRRHGLYTRAQVAELAALTAATKVLRGPLRRALLDRVYARSTGGYSVADIDRVIADLVPLATSRLKQPVLDQLREHQAAGRPLVLVSAGLHEAVVALGGALGGQGEGTRMHRADGRFLPAVDGPVCQGPGKAERARAVLDARGYDAAASFAFGDTASDIPFLELFGHPCAVDPDRRLAAVATERGWPIVRTGAT